MSELEIQQLKDRIEAVEKDNNILRQLIVLYLIAITPTAYYVLVHGIFK